MPVKRRYGKRRMDPRAELERWRSFFECGYDFFGDLEGFGFIDPVRGAPLGPERDRIEAANDKLAREAWNRLGAMFLATWQPDVVRDTPWAVEQFGEPKGGA